MNYDAIPTELKQLRQWVIWRAEIREQGPGEERKSRLTKVPYQPLNPQYGASSTNPNHWATFEQAFAVVCNNPALNYGLGFVFTEHDEYFGIDLDDGENVPLEYRERRQQYVNEIWANTTSYAELSPSKRGCHIICKGRWSIKGRRIEELQMEFYPSGRFFTMTGDVIEGRDKITDEQNLLDSLLASLTANQRTNDTVSLEITTEFGRQLDLTDQEVLQRAMLSDGFAKFFNAIEGAQPGEWSKSYFQLVIRLDRITGDPAQIWRVLKDSPFVTQTPPARDGQKRPYKAHRTFNSTLRRARQYNLTEMPDMERGRSLADQLLAAIRKRDEAERLAITEEAIAREELHEGMSKEAAGLLKRFPPLTENDLTTVYPPGMMGFLVAELERMTDYSFTKYMIPAAFAFVSGVTSRRYKVGRINGMGINLNFLLGGPPSSGKSQVINTVQSVDAYLTANVSNIQARNSHRFVDVSTSSAQAVHAMFLKMPSGAWFVDECKAQLRKLKDDGSKVDEQLKDYINKIYDASKQTKMIEPPMSREGNKNKVSDPITNLGISTFWTTVTESIEINTADATSGYLSRLIVIRHNGRGGTRKQEHEVTSMLPAVLLDRLALLYNLTFETDEAYQYGRVDYPAFLVPVSVDQVRDLRDELDGIVEQIKLKAQDRELPDTYLAIGRMHVNAIKMAATMAVLENPVSPSITPEQLRWSFGYVLKHIASMLSDMDTGELGDKTEDEITTVVKVLKKLRKDPKYRKLGGVPSRIVNEAARGLKPFHGRPGKGKAVSDTIRVMEEIHMIKRENGDDGKTILLVLVEE